MGEFEALLNHLPAFGLVALRSSGIFLTAPIFGQSRVPVIVKSLFGLVIAFLVYPFIEPDPGAVPNQTLLYLIVGLLEVGTGMIYGWTAALMFEGIVLAGQFIGLQMGYAQANILNPVSETQRPILSEVYFLMTLFIFFSINGHHLVIVAFEKSFVTVPLGHFVFNGLVLERILYLFAQVFVVALIIAAPINGILTLIDLIMGLIARTAPQMNVLILGFAIKIYIGLLTLIVSLPFTFRFVRDLMQILLDQLLSIF